MISEDKFNAEDSASENIKLTLIDFNVAKKFGIIVHPDTNGETKIILKTNTGN
jgi:hypothetical protein